MTSPFTIGKYRPIYLWGGPGTIRMNRVKFMNYPVDEAAHQAVHEAPTWGFPPEVEAEDWESLRQAAEHYHKLDSPVFAYVQSSNCVYGGSFVDKDWYARDAKRRKVYYYSWV